MKFQKISVVFVIVGSLVFLSCDEKKVQDSNLPEQEVVKEERSRQINRSFRISPDNPPQSDIHCEFNTFKAVVPTPSGGDIEVDCWTLGCSGDNIESWEVGGCSDEPKSPVIDDLTAAFSPISEKTEENNKTKYRFSFSADNPPQGQQHCWFNTFTSSVPTPSGGSIEVDCWEAGCIGGFTGDWQVGACSDEPEPSGIDILTSSN